jgi:putative oxidoreductase
VKHKPFQTLWQQNRDIGILIIRLFVGLRLFAGGMRKFFEWERTAKFDEALHSLDIHLPPGVIALVFAMQTIAGLFFMLGYKIKIAAAAMACICMLMIIIIPGRSFFNEIMPPFAALMVSVIFFFIAPGKFSLDHRLKSSHRHSPDKGQPL